MHKLLVLLRYIEMFQEMGYLREYIESLTLDPDVKVETIDDLIECFETLGIVGGLLHCPIS